MSEPISFWNLPNLLTVLRILVVPIVCWLLSDAPTVWECQMACLIFGIAMLTDVIDGYLARKWNLVTPLGAYLDPLADKLMVTSVLIMLIPLGWVPAWLIALLLCREITITGLRGIASQQGLTLSAGAMGKIKTAYQSVALCMLIWHHDLWWPIIGVTNVHSAGLALLYCSLFFSLASAIEYFCLYYYATQKPAVE